ncbi:sigma-70 family RNA polymerase sigma factor [Anaerolentibacter hominis]|uniref:RNA polymerase sigma factor n=1 Tax=Anaerolentibacter hominis TaxID=3079009 RepID=UPI0031B851E7
MDDRQIVELYWERSESAISETADKYGRYCHCISYNILHSNADAEECVNDTYLGAWNAMPPHRPSQLATFLGKITRNLSLNRFKQYTAQKRGLGQTELALSELENCVPAAGGVDEATDEMVLIESLNTFLSHLPKIKRQIFVRRYWFLSSIKDISEEYSMSESKVTSMLFRIRADLKLHLEKEGIIL